MKRAAIYTRVSTEDQSENGTSLDTQLAACRKYAQANGWQVTAELREQGVSGATLVRPQLDRLRDMAADGLIDVALIYKLDRLSRDTAQMLGLLKEFQRRGVALKSATVAIEDTPEGVMLLTMLAAIGGFERAQIMERTRRGKEARARQGKVIGTLAAPFGFRYIIGEGRYELVETEAEVVKEIFADIVGHGLSLNEIARRLTARHILAPGGGSTWHKSTIKRILENPIYVGRLCYGRTKSVTGLNKRTPNRNVEIKTQQPRPKAEWIVVEGVVERLVSDAMFDAVAAQLARNSALSKRTCTTEYLLRGHVKCGYCGGSLRGHINNGRRVYECYKQQHRGDPEAQRCPSKTYNAANLEAAVWTALAAHISDPLLLRRIGDEREPSKTIEEKEREQIETLQMAKSRVEASADRLLSVFMDGVLSKEKFTERSKPLNEEVARLDRETAVIQLQALVRDKFVLPEDPMLALLCKHMRHKIKTFTFEERRRLLELSNIRVSVSGDAVRVTGAFTTALLEVGIEADLNADLLRRKGKPAVESEKGEQVEASADLTDLTDGESEGENGDSEASEGDNGDLINPLSITYQRYYAGYTGVQFRLCRSSVRLASCGHTSQAGSGQVRANLRL